MNARCIITKHDVKTHGLDPRTYNISKNSSIDCCFGSTSLKILKGGYLPVGRLHSDYRGVQIDIPTRFFFGYKTPLITVFEARGLNIIDPRVVKIPPLYQDFHKHNLFIRMDNLHRRSLYALSLHLSVKYEDMDKLTETLIK